MGQEEIKQVVQKNAEEEQKQETQVPQVVTEQEDDIDMSIVNSVNFNLGDDLVVYFSPSDKKITVKSSQDEEDIMEMTIEEFEVFAEDASEILKFIKKL